MSDHKKSIFDLKEAVRKFCEERDWDQYHSAKELAIALSIESAELLEIFRWKSKEEVDEMFKHPLKREQIEEEMADVLYFLLRLSQKYQINISNALEKKLEKNAKNYPIEKARGSSKKYDELI